MLQIASRRWEWKIPPAAWSDTVTNAQESQRTNPNDTVAAVYILKWEQGKLVAQMDPRPQTHAAPMWDMRMGRSRTWRPRNRWTNMFERRYTNVGHENGQIKNVVTEEPVDKYVRETLHQCGT